MTRKEWKCFVNEKYVFTTVAQMAENIGKTKGAVRRLLYEMRIRPSCYSTQWYGGLKCQIGCYPPETLKRLVKRVSGEECFCYRSVQSDLDLRDDLLI